MVLRQVEERAHGEPDAVHPAEPQGVAGDLRRDGACPRGSHPGEQGLELGCLGGGEPAGQGAAVHAAAGGADETGDVPAALEGGLDEVGGGGLAGGAGDADDVEVGGRVSGHRRGHRAENRARGGVDEDGQAPGDGGHQLDALGVGEHRGCARLDGGGPERGAVDAGSGQGGEEDARAAVLGPDGRPGEVEVGPGPVAEEPGPHRICQLSRRGHRLSSPRLPRSIPPVNPLHATLPGAGHRACRTSSGAGADGGMLSLLTSHDAMSWNSGAADAPSTPREGASSMMAIT